jgi:hypothetical protein
LPQVPTTSPVDTITRQVATISPAIPAVSTSSLITCYLRDKAGVRTLLNSLLATALQHFLDLDQFVERSILGFGDLSQIAEHIFYHDDYPL